MIPRAMLAVAYVTDRASYARQVKGDDPDKKGYPGPPGWGLGVRLTTPPHKKYCYETSRGGQGLPSAVEPMMMMMMMTTTMTLAPTCFGSYKNHPQGAVRHLVKTTNNYKYL
jgi:hypothetical protein